MLHALKSAGMPLPGCCMGGDLLAKEHEDPVDPSRSGPSCGVCQIIVEENFGRYLKPISFLEKNRIERSYGDMPSHLTRLACALAVEPWMNGMHLYVPYQQPQRPEDFHLFLAKGHERLL